MEEKEMYAIGGICIVVLAVILYSTVINPDVFISVWKMVHGM
jgi:hypothetical protein